MNDRLVASHVLSFGADETKEKNKYPFTDRFVHLSESLLIFNVENSWFCDNRDGDNENFGRMYKIIKSILFIMTIITMMMNSNKDKNYRATISSPLRFAYSIVLLVPPGSPLYTAIRRAARSTMN